MKLRGGKKNRSEFWGEGDQRARIRKGGSPFQSRKGRINPLRPCGGKKKARKKYRQRERVPRMKGKKGVTVTKSKRKKGIYLSAAPGGAMVSLQGPKRGGGRIKKVTKKGGRRRTLREKPARHLKKL